jgi:hypothetical protein
MQLQPTVTIDYMAYQKIMHWVNASEYEVSGLGKVIVDKQTIRVVDAMLLPQRNTAGSTDIEPEDVGKAMFELRHTPGDLRLWWHSHVKGGVFWSGTDDDTMAKLAAAGWFLNIVFNQRWENRTALQFGKPFGLRIDELKLHVNHELPQAMRDLWDAEYKKNVTNVTFTRPAMVGTGTQTQPSGNGILVWDTELGGYVPEHLGKKSRKKWLKRARLRKLQESGVQGFLKAPAEECPLCNYKFSCVCPPIERERAEDLERDGRCFVCSSKVDDCKCTDFDLQHYLGRFKGKEEFDEIPARPAAKKGSPPSSGGNTGGIW